MRSKIYKHAWLMIVAFITISLPAIAQKAGAITPATPEVEVQEVIIPETPELTRVQVNDVKVNVSVNRRKLKRLSRDISRSVNKSIKTVNRTLATTLDELGPALASISNEISIEMDNDTDEERVREVNKGDLDEQEKTYSKSYSCDRDDVLDISNKYGSVTVNTWNKNEFKVDVKIKIGTSKSGAAKKMLDDVTIADRKEGSTVYFKTEFAEDSGNGNSMSFFGTRKTTRNIEVNYTVYMPAKNALTINNKYGPIILPDLYGKLNISSSYGSLSAKNLPHTANAIVVKYGSANIQGLTGCDLNVAYGNLNLAESDNVNTTVSYGAAKIGNIKTSGNINVKYSGGLNIGSLDKNLKSLNINSSYSGVRVGVNTSPNIDFDVTVNYGGFNYDDNFVFIVDKNPADDEKGWNPTKNFKGHLGKGGSTDKVITIKSKYGSVKFE